MGCNCKKQVDSIAKYADDVENKNTNPLIKVFEFILQIAFGILCGAIIIVMIIPMLIYLIICMMLGKEATFKLKKINKYFTKKQ